MCHSQQARGPEQCLSPIPTGDTEPARGCPQEGNLRVRRAGECRSCCRETAHSAGPRHLSPGPRSGEPRLPAELSVFGGTPPPPSPGVALPPARPRLWPGKAAPHRSGSSQSIFSLLLTFCFLFDRPKVIARSQ